MEIECKDLVSIIIPVYNVETFVRRCINSVQRQKYQNIEIIIVDDGSTDKSGAICEELAKTDERLIVLHKQNGGQSSARNVGIKNSHGKYIAFVDSDDFIHEEYISAMHSIAVESGAEIVICNYEKGKKSSFSNNNTDKIADNSYDVYTSIQMLENWHSVFCAQETSPCNKLIYKNILVRMNFQYPEGVFYEDVMTTHLLVVAASRVAVTGRKLYYYYRRKNSTTKQLRNEKNIRDNLFAQDKRLGFFIKMGYEEAAHRLMIGRQKHYMLMFCLTDSQEIRKELKELFQISYKALMEFRETTLIERLMFRIFRIIFIHGNFATGEK